VSRDFRRGREATKSPPRGGGGRARGGPRAHAARIRTRAFAAGAIAALAQIEKKKAEAAVRRQASRLEKRVRITTLMVYVALERVKAGFLESLALSREAAPDLGVFRASQAVLQEPFLTAATPPDVLWREITRNVGRRTAASDGRKTSRAARRRAGPLRRGPRRGPCAALAARLRAV
jgi:hypothetical protein